ncbi:MAG: IMPACT family protein [Anaerovoracaceae bacterium]
MEKVIYCTISEEVWVKQTIEKSKFIATFRPVKSQEEGKAFVLEMKKKYKDATHNVPVIIVGNKQEYQWCSDDGEPHGTSGRPVLFMLTKLGYTNVAIVVTRYFGGKKLGKGGLVRAYTGTARLTVEAAEKKNI